MKPVYNPIYSDFWVSFLTSSFFQRVLIFRFLGFFVFCFFIFDFSVQYRTLQQQGLFFQKIYSKFSSSSIETTLDKFANLLLNFSSRVFGHVAARLRFFHSRIPCVQSTGVSSRLQL